MKPNCPMQFDGIDHVVLNVTDSERALQFYTQVLGLTVERVIEDLHIYQLRCGRNIIDLRVLSQGKTLAQKEERGIDHLCLMMHGDVDVIVNYLKEHDVPIVFGPVELYGATGFGTSMYVLDPDGHTLELKADYAQYPIRTTGKEAMAGLTRLRAEPYSDGCPTSSPSGAVGCRRFRPTLKHRATLMPPAEAGS
ncbi:MAG: VOC family protein [Deltaproteobacteria bacterium]|nr:VOC family protein [Deltaproteobacteria bacterium]